ncbi:MAG: TIGR04013 family B12-binding domain/radical SAM domain-containing protein [Candidatus Thorarchaeota archaeon]
MSGPLTDCRLLFRFHRHSRYSIAALVGAVETDPRLSALQIELLSESGSHILRHGDPDERVIAAFSVMSTQVDRVIAEARAIRNEMQDRVILVAGGPHATARPRDLLDSCFDYVVIGEGEYAFPELLLRLIDDRNPLSIPGVVGKETETIPTPASLPRINLDEYPPFALEKNVLGPVEVTRGCAFRCKFCATPFLTGGVVRHRSVECVAKWLRQAVERRGFRRTWFLSPNALCYGGRGHGPALGKLERLLDQVSRVGIEQVFFGTFPSEVRPDFVTRDSLEIMRQYVANESLQIGIQSGSDRVLDLVNRHHTVDQGLDAVRLALDFGFRPHVDMIFGLPGEGPQDLKRTLDICHELVEMGAKLHGHVFMPLPGSEFENSLPMALDSETRQELGELTRKGHMTGAWANQEILGKSMARARNDAEGSMPKTDMW